MASHGIVLPTREVVQSADDPGTSSGRTRSKVLDLARGVEGAGLDGVWVGDSVLARPRLEPLTTLASVGAITDGLTLGTAVYLPALRHPVNIAHQTATISRLTEERLILGVGVGFGPNVEREYGQLGVPYDRRGAVLDETLEALSGLWSGEEVSIDGEFVNLEAADQGVYPPSPPSVYVASAPLSADGRFPRPVRNRIATYGGGWIPIAMDAETYATGLERARGRVAAAGRDPEDFDAAYYQDVVIAESRDAALEEARTFLDRYYPIANEFTDERIERRGAFGPPEVVREHLRAYEAAGVDTFVTRFTASNQHEQLRRYADVVT